MTLPAESDTQLGDGAAARLRQLRDECEALQPQQLDAVVTLRHSSCLPPLTRARYAARDLLAAAGRADELEVLFGELVQLCPASRARAVLRDVLTAALVVDLDAEVAETLERPWREGLLLAAWTASAPPHHVGIVDQLLPDWTGSLAELLITAADMCAVD